MEKCNYCKTEAKILILKQDNNSQDLICPVCAISKYGEQLGWMGKQVVQGVMTKLEQTK